MPKKILEKVALVELIFQTGTENRNEKFKNHLIYLDCQNNMLFNTSQHWPTYISKTRHILDLLIVL